MRKMVLQKNAMGQQSLIAYKLIARDTQICVYTHIHTHMCVCVLIQKGAAFFYTYKLRKQTLSRETKLTEAEITNNTHASGNKK